MISRRYRSLYIKFIRRGRLLLFLVLFSAILWVLYDDESFNALADPVKEFLVARSGDMGLVLENVYISGQDHASSEEILNSIQAIKGKPLLGLDISGSKESIENIGWVKEAKIERQFPNTLHIMITEREPFAIWQYMGKISLIDRDGNIIVDGGVEGFTELPIIVGEDAHLYVVELFRFLVEDSDLFNKVSSVIRVGGRRWNVRFKNGIEIKLPEENADKAWQHLLQLNQEKRLLDRKIDIIDLRVPGRLFIEPHK